MKKINGKEKVTMVVENGQLIIPLKDICQVMVDRFGDGQEMKFKDENGSNYSIIVSIIGRG